MSAATACETTCCTREKGTSTCCGHQQNHPTLLLPLRILKEATLQQQRHLLRQTMLANLPCGFQRQARLGDLARRVEMKSVWTTSMGEGLPPFPVGAPLWLQRHQWPTLD